jgi:hypothetical protein
VREKQQVNDNQLSRVAQVLHAWFLGLCLTNNSQQFTERKIHSKSPLTMSESPQQLSKKTIINGCFLQSKFHFNDDVAA